MYLRLAAAVAALAAGAVGIVVAVTELQSVPGPTSVAASTTVSTPAPSVAPSAGTSVVLAQEAGTHALAIAVTQSRVRVTVLNAAGERVKNPHASIRRKAHEVIVLFGGKSYRFSLPTLPAPSAAAIVAKATATWKGLHTLRWHEVLASSPTNALHTVYVAQAPDRLSYTIAGKSAAVIVGGKRWDRPTPHAKWQESLQDPPVSQPWPFWSEATNAHILGTAEVGGHAVWRVSFLDPTTPAWFTAWIDKRTYRTLRLDMIAASHFMHDVYGPFNSPVHLAPPA